MKVEIVEAKRDISDVAHDLSNIQNIKPIRALENLIYDIDIDSYDMDDEKSKVAYAKKIWRFRSLQDDLFKRIRATVDALQKEAIDMTDADRKKYKLSADMADPIK
jgi:hypothetical protein